MTSTKTGLTACRAGAGESDGSSIHLRVAEADVPSEAGDDGGLGVRTEEVQVDRGEFERTVRKLRPDGLEDHDVPAVDVQGGVEAGDGLVPQHSDEVHLVREPEAVEVVIPLREMFKVLWIDGRHTEHTVGASGRDEGELPGE